MKAKRTPVLILLSFIIIAFVGCGEDDSSPALPGTPLTDGGMVGAFASKSYSCRDSSGQDTPLAQANVMRSTIIMAGNKMHMQDFVSSDFFMSNGSDTSGSFVNGSRNLFSIDRSFATYTDTTTDTNILIIAGRDSSSEASTERSDLYPDAQIRTSQNTPKMMETLFRAAELQFTYSFKETAQGSRVFFLEMVSTTKDVNQEICNGNQLVISYDRKDASRFHDLN